jgi:hypothetical protein
MKKMKLSVATLLCGGSMMLMSSCLGSFSLFHKVLKWNNDVSNNKWVNELLFFALCIVPVYEFSWFLDSILFNSLEFWTGNSPMAGVDATIKGEKGEYHVKSSDKGYHVELLGSNEAMDLLFDTATGTWTMAKDGKSVKLVQFVDGNAKVYFGATEVNANMKNTLHLLAAR